MKIQTIGIVRVHEVVN